MNKDTVFRKTDKDGNSALHLAASFSEYRPRLSPSPAPQMQWEIKWYEVCQLYYILPLFRRKGFVFVLGGLVEKVFAWVFLNEK